MVGIRDRSIAFEFDMRCGELLVEFEADREQQQMEAIATGAVARTLSGAQGTKIERTKPIVLNA